MRKLVLYITILFSTHCGLAQSIPERHLYTDIQHYIFSISLTDGNDTIQGEAVVTARFLKQSSVFSIDLAGDDSLRSGMAVLSVQENGRTVSFRHVRNVLTIETTAAENDTKTFTIRYQGKPADGLIISKNKYAHRTIFADNWPDRAHNWIPCKDHPADKATVEFIITAPDHYRVVANGLLKEETSLPGNTKRTRWNESVALPVKVMAIGLADFAVSDPCYADSIPVYSYVYAEDKQAGFYDYGFACSILPWYVKYIGPYPFEKLANVQSKTVFGGMENASAIFYAENSVRGNGRAEDLLAHEIAHQWFGDAATETDWQHIWLSEGFATYMTNLYLESKYGRDTLVKRLRQDRNEVTALSRRRPSPVVDSSVHSNFLQLLNANSYQQGGWVLHMLRCQLGDAVFQKGIQAYYAAFSGKNASTPDFRRAMEKASGKDLELFFRQWLYTAGQPVLSLQWQYDSVKHVADITIVQSQPTLFSFPVEIGILSSGSGLTFTTINVKDKETHLSLPAGTRPGNIILDPNTKLLFELAH